MKTNLYHGNGRLWPLGWVILVRAILYLVVVGFLLQYIYFGETGLIYRPGEAIVLLVAAFIVNLFILTLGSESRRPDHLIAFTYVLDLAVVTRVALSSGGFNSIFIPYYLPILVMATAWMPRRYTAIFPSMATLGAAYIGCGHLLVSLGESDLVPTLYPRGALYLLRYAPDHSVVANMLILIVLFFVVSYLSGIVSDKLFLEERLNAEILSSMKEGVAVADRAGQLAYANAEFYRIFPDASPASFRAIAKELLHRDDGAVSLNDLLERKGGDSLVLVHDNTGRPERPPLEARVSGISLRGSDDVFGLVFMVTDLSLRRRVEAAERNLARFSAISTMAAGLAHEIRNPLASLRSAIQEIGSSFPPDSQDRQLTDIVMAESDRLDRIIGRFLDFSREGELRLSRQRLGAVLDDIRTMLLHDVAGRGLDVTVVVKDDPDVSCDADRVKEVFFNLALNAAQMSPKPGGRLEIVLEAAEKGVVPGVEVSFKDNGPGLSEDAVVHMFEPFFSNREGGTGMGLALSRKQVNMHGGDITAVNLEGGGACFRVWLPVEPVTAPPEPRRRRAGYTEIIRADRVADALDGG